MPFEQQTPISNLPIGLLDFLGIRSQGEYPRYLSRDIQPYLDLQEFVLASRDELVSGTVSQGATAGGSFPFATPIIVPQNEIWLVRHASLQATTGVGETVAGFCPILLRVAAAVNMLFPLAPAVAVAASSVAIAGSAQGAYVPTVWGPGCEFRAWLQLVAGGVVDFVGMLNFARFRV